MLRYVSGCFAFGHEQISQLFKIKCWDMCQVVLLLVMNKYLNCLRLNVEICVRLLCFWSWFKIKCWDMCQVVLLLVMNKYLNCLRLNVEICGCFAFGHGLRLNVEICVRLLLLVMNKYLNCLTLNVEICVRLFCFWSWTNISIV